MKREILVRCWDTLYKRFVDLSNPKNGLKITDIGIEMSTGYDSIDNASFGMLDREGYPKMTEQEYEYFQGRFVYQQYTGLKDRNGNKIFEGDIVQSSCKKILKDEFEGDDLVYLPKSENRTYKNVIDWYDGIRISGWRIKGKRFQTALKCSTIGNMNLEVIGNIYDNPELVTDKTE